MYQCVIVAAVVPALEGMPGKSKVFWLLWILPSVVSGDCNLFERYVGNKIVHQFGLGHPLAGEHLTGLVRQMQCTFVEVTEFWERDYKRRHVLLLALIIWRPLPAYGLNLQAVQEQKPVCEKDANWFIK